MKRASTIRLGLYFLWIGATVGCSGSSPDSGDVSGIGGSLVNTGGLGAASGGKGVDTTAGGSSGTGAGAPGGTSTAGTNNSGGAAGGTVAKGGTASGGASTVGGNGIGGATSTGGALATGGRSDTGGANATGGTGVGGQVTGGRSGTGGANATGGTGVGGQATTGGQSLTGGRTGTGGRSTTGGNVGTGGSAGSSGSSAVCKEPPTVFALPSDFPRPPAKKALLACGVYVVGSSAVADAALIRAQQILQVELLKLCTDIPTASSKFTSSKSRIVILGKNEDQSLYWAGNSGRRSWCAWPDANGMIETVTLEEELTSGQRYLLMTTVHEMGHFTQFALSLWNKPLYDRSVGAFQNCTKAYYNDYDLQNDAEFFAGDTLRWFDLNPSDLAVPDAGTLTQREQLKKYSPAMYQIMSEVFVTTTIP